MAFTISQLCQPDCLHVWQPITITPGKTVMLRGLGRHLPSGISSFELCTLPEVLPHNEKAIWTNITLRNRMPIGYTYLPSTTNTSLISPPGSAFSITRVVYPLLIGITQELSLAFCQHFQATILTRAVPLDEGAKSHLFSFWLNSIAAFSPETHTIVVQWALENNIAPANEENLGITLHNAPLYPNDSRLLHTFLAFTLGFKNVNQEFITVWTDRRLSAVCASMGISQTASSSSQSMGQFPTAQLVATYLAEQKSLLRGLVDYVRANMVENTSVSVRKFCDSVHMIMHGAGMATITAAHQFATTGQTAAMLLITVNQEAADLDEAIVALKKPPEETTQLKGATVRGLGDMFGFARCLELPGVEYLNATRYPSLCYCAWFHKARDSPTYKQMVHPQADNAKTLAAFTSVSLMQGYNSLSIRNREILDDFGITEATYSELMRRVEAAHAGITPQELVSTQVRIKAIQ